MKKFNKNILVFAFAILFIVAGFFGNGWNSILSTFSDVSKKVAQGQIKNAVDDVVDYSNNTFQKELSYHDNLMDLYSVKENILGTRKIKDVIKTNSGRLADKSRSKMSQDDIEWAVSQIKELEIISERNDAKFEYFAIPEKDVLEEFPSNFEIHNKDNYARFLDQLRKESIPYYDLLPELSKQCNDIFFDTDHHWKPYAAFLSSGLICRELNSKYRFNYDEKYLNINNYTVTTFDDYYLGWAGKSTGRYFTWRGADDFDLITPKFFTNCTAEEPFKNQIRAGTFDETYLFKDNLKKDYYNGDAYSIYSGGQYRLQIFRNNLSSDGKKILVFRDSFFNPVAPFLALNTQELHTCDVRSYGEYVGEKIKAEQYIKQIKPDYVIVLYFGVAKEDESAGRFDFF